MCQIHYQEYCIKNEEFPTFIFFNSVQEKMGYPLCECYNIWLELSFEKETVMTSNQLRLRSANLQNTLTMKYK